MLPMGTKTVGMSMLGLQGPLQGQPCARVPNWVHGGVGLWGQGTVACPHHRTKRTKEKARSKRHKAEGNMQKAAKAEGMSKRGRQQADRKRPRHVQVVKVVKGAMSREGQGSLADVPHRAEENVWIFAHGGLPFV